MGAPTETYVDPAIAANSGTGTSGDPYGDLQYALNTMTRDATNGDRINIKAGTDEVLTAAISLATYGTPGSGSPLIFQGYTSAAGDGGIGGISGAATYAIYSAGANYVQWRDLHLHNSGSATILTLGSFGNEVIGCEFDNTTGSGITASISNALILSCNFHNIATYGVTKTSTGSLHIIGCYFANGTNDFNAAISLFRDGTAERNIISIDGASDGIVSTTYFGRIANNSILSAGGTGQGIVASGAAGVDGDILNNLVEGFSGSGGIGIQITSDINAYGMNAVYNCATAYSVTGDTFHNFGDNESLGASPFDKSGSDTFANRATYFAPVDTGSVRGGAYPTALRLDKGAVQHADPAGGGGLLTHSGMNGGLRG